MSSDIFSKAIKDAQTTVLQCHVLVVCFFTAQIVMSTGVLLFLLDTATWQFQVKECKIISEPSLLTG